MPGRDATHTAAVETDALWRQWCRGLDRAPEAGRRAAAKPAFPGQPGAAETRPPAPRQAPLDTDVLFRNWAREALAGAPPARQPTRRPARAQERRPPPDPVRPAAPLTEGEAAWQDAAQRARRASMRWGAVAQRIDRMRAEQRAEQLLRDHLTPEQREQYDRDGFIVVPGRLHPQYRIRKGRVANVEALDEQGHITHRLCAHPQPMVPDADTVLAQMLMLRHHEAQFVDTANVSPMIRPQRRADDGNPPQT